MKIVLELNMGSTLSHLLINGRQYLVKDEIGVRDNSIVPTMHENMF